MLSLEININHIHEYCIKINFTYMILCLDIFTSLMLRCAVFFYCVNFHICSSCMHGYYITLNNIFFLHFCAIHVLTVTIAALHMAVLYSRRVNRKNTTYTPQMTSKFKRKNGVGSCVIKL